MTATQTPRRIVRPLASTLPFLATVVLGSAAFADIALNYDVTPVGNGLGAAGGGQAFKPVDAAGAAGAAKLNLKSFKMWRGAGGFATSQVSATTYLVIYNGNPDTATQVGASSNSLDIGLNDAAGTEYLWNFDNLELDPQTTYWAVLANNPVDNNILQSAGGTWLQMSLQTHTTAYTNGWSIIANRNAHESKLDLRFVATFADPVLPPKLVSYTRDPAGVTSTIVWKSELGTTYSVWGSPDFQAWSELTAAAGVAGTGEDMSFIDTPAGAPGKYFYQVRTK